jgi:CYTH domain-containing protein
MTASDAVARIEEHAELVLRATALEAVRLLLAGSAAPSGDPAWPAFDALFRRVRGKNPVDACEVCVAEFVGEVEREAARSESGRRIEIERTYRLRGLPERVSDIRPIEILQGYLPGKRIHERIRAAGRDDRASYYRTIKLGRGIAKIEVQEEMPREMFQTMWPLTDAARIHKRRYVVEDRSFVWEIDEFLDRDLVLAEVELPHPEIRPPLPTWLAPYVIRDVTGDPAYLNVNLARASAPARDR